MHSIKKMEFFKWLDHVEYNKKTENYSLSDWCSAFHFRSQLFYAWVTTSPMKSDRISEHKYDSLISSNKRFSIDDPLYFYMCFFGPKIDRIDLITSLSMLNSELLPAGVFGPSDYSPVETPDAPTLAAFASGLFLSCNEIADSETSPSDFLMADDVLSEFEGEPFYLVGPVPRKPLAEAYGGITFAAIDLYASDQEILLAMKKWLIKTKADFGVPKKGKAFFNDADMRNWHKNRLLQYLDLTLFAHIEGIELLDHEIAALLFPDEYELNITDKIKDTVRPNAEKMRNGTVVERLIRQVEISTSMM